MRQPDSIKKRQNMASPRSSAFHARDVETQRYFLISPCHISEDGISIFMEYRSINITIEAGLEEHFQHCGIGICGWTPADGR
jgi:hypothetical protein